MYMYITVSEEDRIARYEVDAGTGALTHIGMSGLLLDLRRWR